MVTKRQGFGIQFQIIDSEKSSASVFVNRLDCRLNQQTANYT